MSSLVGMIAKFADPLVDEPNYGSRRLRISLVEMSSEVARMSNMRDSKQSDTTSTRPLLPDSLRLSGLLATCFV